MGLAKYPSVHLLLILVAILPLRCSGIVTTSAPFPGSSPTPRDTTNVGVSTVSTLVPTTGRTTSSPLTTATQGGLTTDTHKPSTARDVTTLVTTQAPSDKVTTVAPSGNATTLDPYGNGTTPVGPTMRPPDQPKVGDYMVNGTNGQVCMRMSFGMAVNISYTRSNRQKSYLRLIMDPKIAHAASDCNPLTRSFKLYPFGRLYPDWKVDLTFTKKSGMYALTEILVGWDYDAHFNNPNVFGYYYETKGTDNYLLQAVGLGMSYNCSKPLTVETGVATVRITEMRMQPFAEDAEGEFGKAEQCGVPHKGNSAVVIVIVIAVIATVAIVVALLVIRHRRKRRVPYGDLSNLVA